MEVRTQAFTGHKGKWGLGGKGRPRITLKGRQAASGARLAASQCGGFYSRELPAPEGGSFPVKAQLPGKGFQAYN